MRTELWRFWGGRWLRGEGYKLHNAGMEMDYDSVMILRTKPLRLHACCGLGIDGISRTAIKLPLSGKEWTSKIFDLVSGNV